MRRCGWAALIGATSTSVGKDLLPRVAGILDAGLAPDVSAVLGAKQFRRASNAGNALQTLEVHGDIIVVSVTIDTISQIQSHLVAHQYEGLIKKSKLKGK